MKKLSFKIASLLLLLLTAASCSKSTESYADLVDNEEGYINDFKKKANITSVIEIDEDVLSSWTSKILNDSIEPSSLVNKDQWYMVSEGDFKRLYFRIKDFGTRPKDAASFYKNKITTGSYVLVRYEDCYLLNDFKEFDKRKAGDNLGPYNYQMIYNWNPSYYASTYYAAYYGASKEDECTSGGLGFPVRFMWYGGEAELIVPFSLVSTDLSSGYYTLYYGTVRYTKPTYIPQSN